MILLFCIVTLFGVISGMYQQKDHIEDGDMMLRNGVTVTVRRQAKVGANWQLVV